MKAWLSIILFIWPTKEPRPTTLNRLPRTAANNRSSDFQMDHAASPAKTPTDLNRNTVCDYSLHSKDLKMKEVGRQFSPWLSQLHCLPSL